MVTTRQQAKTKEMNGQQDMALTPKVGRGRGVPKALTTPVPKQASGHPNGVSDAEAKMQEKVMESTTTKVGELVLIAPCVGVPPGDVAVVDTSSSTLAPTASGPSDIGGEGMHVGTVVEPMDVAGTVNDVPVDAGSQAAGPSSVRGPVSSASLGGASGGSVPSTSATGSVLSIAANAVVSGAPAVRYPGNSASRPQIAPLAMSGVPVPTTPFTGEYHQVDDLQKIGRSSVVPNNVVAFPVGSCPEQTQTILAGLRKLLTAQPERVDVQEREIVITGIVSMPPLRGDAPMARVTTHFNRTYPEDAPTRRTQLTFAPPVIIGEVDPAIQAQYIKNNLAEFRPTSSALRGQVIMEMTMANRITTLLSEAAQDFDLMGLFTIIHLMVDYLYFLQRLGINAVVAPNQPDYIAFINVNPPAGDIVAATNEVTNAVMQGKLCFDNRWVSVQDMRCMMAVSAGPAFFNIGAPANVPIHHNIRTPPIYWALWDNAPIVNPGAGMISISDLLAFAEKVVKHYSCRHAYVRGFIRASMLINGMVEVIGVGNHIYMSSCLEFERFSVPRPRGRNMVWMLLQAVWTSTINPLFFEAEFFALAGLQVAGMVQLGAAVAAMVSLATSTVFHHFNITGRELTMWAGRDPALSTHVINQLFYPASGRECTLLHMSTTLVVAAFSGMSIHWRCFSTTSWSNGFEHRVMELNDGWQHIWHRHVPYPVLVLSMEWAVYSWILEWGYSGPNPVYNMGNEMFVAGPAASRGVYVHEGDVKYVQATQSQSTFVYQVYGALFINTVRGDWRCGDAMPISFQTISRSDSGHVIYGRELLREDDLQPLYNVDIYAILPGTLISYDWVRNCTLGPVLLASDMDGDVFQNWLRNSRTDVVSAAGFSTRFAPQLGEIAITQFDMSNLLFGAGGNKQVAGASMDDSAREGN